MKKCIAWILVLCLLLTACGGTTTGDGESKPTAAPDPFTPYYSDYAVRSMQATVVSVTEELGVMGVLNNLYENQAATLYQKLNTAAYRESWLATPTDIARVQITLRPHSDTAGEVYTLYENDLVLVEHPAVGKQLYTAAAGTYYQTVTYLKGVRTAQSAHFTVQAEGIDETGHHPAGYTLKNKNGKTADQVNTGQEIPCVDLVAQGIVRVTAADTVRLYDTATGRNVVLPATASDVAGGYVAAATATSVTLYPLFSKKAAACVFVEAAGAEQPVQGISFTADGKGLHVICCRGDTNTVWDRTLMVADLLATTRYYLGAWQTTPDTTEKEQQTVGYNLLKKLRHKEKALGRTLSALPEKRLQLGDDVYFLTEVGYWEKVDSTYTYTPVVHLLVDEDVTVAYETTTSDNELTWDTKKNWTKR